MATIVEAKEKFEQYGLGNHLEFMSRVETYLRKEYVLDIAKFDDMLKARFQEEYHENISVKQFLTKKYGVEVCSFIKSLL